MSIERGVGEVRPIFRKGDRVVVKIEFGFCEIIIQRHEIKNGRVWLYGTFQGIAVLFPATKVLRRLTQHQALKWPNVV
jgi:hypothetical protein